MKHIYEIIDSHFLEPERSEAIELLREVSFVSVLDSALEQVRSGIAPETWSNTAEMTLRQVNSCLAKEQNLEKKRAFEAVLSKLMRCVMLDLVTQYPEKLSGIIAGLRRECYRQKYDFQALNSLLDLDMLKAIADEQIGESDPIDSSVEASIHTYLQWLRTSDELQVLDQALFKKKAIYHQSDFSALFNADSAAALSWNPEHFEFMLVLLEKLWKGHRPAISSPPGSKAFWEIIARRCKAVESTKTAKGLATHLSKLKKTDKYEKYILDFQDVMNKNSGKK